VVPLADGQRRADRLALLVVRGCAKPKGGGAWRLVEEERL
jgi:hypothetical protein